MPNKMIPFPYKIKITPDFCYYGIYYSNTDRQNKSLFLIHFFIFIIMAVRRMV